MSVLLSIVLTVGAIPTARPHATTASAARIETLTLDGNAEKAVESGRAAVTAHPDDLDIRLALARALAAKARHVKKLVNVTMSQRDVERGSATVPGAALDQATARVDYDTALFEEANGHLEFAIQHAPQRQDLRVFQCFLLTDSGHIEAARAAIVSALGSLTKTPALAKTMAAYGVERAKRNDTAGGAALLAPVVQAFPTDAALLVDYANLLTRLGRKSEAFTAFDRATALAPQEAGYARTKAIGAMLLRDYRRAQGAFDAAFGIGHDVADAFASHAAAYGIDPKASAALMGALVTNGPSTDPSVATLAGQFVRAATTGPSSEPAMTLARSLVAAEQYVFVIPVLDRAIQADEKNAEAKKLLKSAYVALGCGSLTP